ncbi:MAG TPA: hypothetical protein VJ785_08085 [Anaerolineales bacterium]|nr:hypothetical protein [Anaerolineales bacterium]
MFRNVSLISLLFLALSIFTASAPVTTQTSMITILPEDCQVMVGEELALELSGPLASGAAFTWDVDYGEVASVLPGSSAVLVAPPTPSVITVYALVSDAKPGRWIYVTRQCTVSPPINVNG